ncbi:MAG: RNA methyltransferase [Prevotellaceae bacterium]|jgi:TrmH family RNA methyltransferase|nr:RNA methyltransferase [Prevotellaceae bacterium]
MFASEIKWIKSLSQKKIRDEYGLFIVEGKKMVEELVCSTFTTHRIITAQPLDFPVAGCPVEQVNAATMARLSALKTPPAVLAIVEKPVATKFPPPAPDELLLALDNIQDPGNLGTIIRLADWFGIRRLVCSPGTADCYNPKVVQATMGAIFRVEIHYTELPEFLWQAKKSTAVYGAFLDGDNIYQKQLTPGGVVVVGNEGNGISPEAAAAVSGRLFIPPYPAGAITSESLNVAASAAILCAEFRRRNVPVIR